MATPVSARFTSFIKVDFESGCWLWTGALSSQGMYGGFTNDSGQFCYAHVFAFELLNGPVPDGCIVHHECHNPRCVRPSHLAAIPREEHYRLHFEERRQRSLKRAAECGSLRESDLTVKQIAKKVNLSTSRVYELLHIHRDTSAALAQAA
jgi:hypothetical protein